MTGVVSFHVAIPDSALDDLRDRLTRPLLLLHGWPSSTVEYLDVVGPLAAAGHPVVVPSLPGFGFSGPTREPGWDVRRMAAAFAELMDRLGYGRYAAHGGDWGAFTARELGRTHPERVAAVHVTTLPAAVPLTEPTPDDLAALPEAEASRTVAAYRRRAEAQAEEMGFGILQSTRPQTLAYGLADSPAGQLAWIAEKMHAWAGEPIDRDRLLTTVSVYWLTGTAASSARIYYETAHGGGMAAALLPSQVPTGVIVFPRDTALSVRHLAERTDRIVHWTYAERGGHFPGFEAPDLLAADLLAFVRTAHSAGGSRTGSTASRQDG